MCGDALERDFAILAEPNVAVMPADTVVVVGVIVPQYLAVLRVVVLKPVEPPTGVVVVLDGEYLHAPSRDRAVQFKRVISGYHSSLAKPHPSVV